MPHAQQIILDRVQTVLAAGATVAGARVFVDRVDPLLSTELPAILIREGEEGETAETAYANGDQERTLRVTVIGVLAHSTTAAANARELGLAIEKLLVADATLRTLCSLGLAIESSAGRIDGEADRLMAQRQQTWRMTYQVAPGAPDVIL